MNYAKPNLWILKSVFFILLLPMAECSYAAVDGYSLEAGEGTQSAIAQIGVQYSSEWMDQLFSNSSIKGYWEPSLALIDCKKYQNQTGQSDTFYDVGLTPILRWQGDSPHGLFGEIGIGLNYMTQKMNNDGKMMSTHFQFGDSVGLGYQFDNNVSITLKFKHFSNAGIKEPNPAINFGMINVAYSF
jgi:hypothetical protein